MEGNLSEVVEALQTRDVELRLAEQMKPTH